MAMGFLPPSPVTRQLRVSPSFQRPQRTHNQHNNLTRCSAPTTTTALSPLHEHIARINDTSAHKMLDTLSATPLQTSLHPETITTTHVTHTNPTNNPSIIFLHGFDSNLLEYRRLHTILAQKPPSTLHYLDILGWGMTERPEGISYGPLAKREHLRAFVDTFEPHNPVILVGASIGAATAVDFALAFPERVSRIVLIGGQVYIDRPKAPIPKFLAEVGADVLRSNWLRSIAVEMSYEKDEFKCDDVLNIGGLHCKMEGWKHSMVDFIMGEGYCLSDSVKHVSGKSLVIWGEHDRVLPQGDLEKFRRDGFEIMLAEGCGHSPHIEDPEFVAQQIQRIVESV